MKRILIYLLPLALGWSCANQVPLEGGPKDATAPVMRKSEPDTFALNFRGRKIVLGFDEYVVLKNATKEVVVSPPVAEAPVVQVTGKSIEVIFADSLKPNTTYTINFGNAIADNNEGNVLKNYAFTFSTGAVLDSLSLSATLLDAYTLKPVPEAKWLLYDAMNDTVVQKGNPFYIGYTGKTGQAVIRYMHTAPYYAVALLESNNNNRYDVADEWVGFMDTTVTPGDSVDHRVLVFREKSVNNKLKSVRIIRKGQVGFRFLNDASDVKIRSLTDSLPPTRGHLEWLSEAKDTAVYWYKPVKADTLYFELTYPDQRMDTVRVVSRTKGGGSGGGGPRSGGKSKTDTPPVNTAGDKLELTTNLSARFDYFRDVELRFSRPVPDFDSTCLVLLEEGKPKPFRWSYADSVQRVVKLSYPFKQAKNYTLRLADSCFADIWGMYNDSLVVNFKTSQAREYAALTITATGVTGTSQLIFLLLDDKDNVLQTKKVHPTDGKYPVQFINLLPGAYRVKIVYDANGNGTWDTGEFKTRRQPERVSFFPKQIDMKPGFDASFDWDVNAPVKPGSDGGRGGDGIKK